MKLSFKSFINENLDIYGMDRDRDKTKPEAQNDGLPINTFNLEEFVNILSENKLGVKEPSINFVNQITWGGNHTGSVRLKVSPNLQCRLQKQGIDLEGTQVWYDKKYVAINRTGYGGHEQDVAGRVANLLEEIDKEGVDSPNREYAGLESLAVKMASKIRQTASEVFMFNKTKKLNDNNYVIQMSVQGSGTGGLQNSQYKIAENQTNISYDKRTGMIRVFNNNLESGPKGRSWIPAESGFDCSFFPSQPEEEIISVVATFLKYY